MEQGPARRWAPWVALAATLLVALLLKEPCTDRFDGVFEYEALCYSDIVPLYIVRHLDQDTFPYIDHEGDASGKPLGERSGFLEYPVLTGLLLWSAAAMGTLQTELMGGAETTRLFFLWNAAFLTLFAAGTLYVLNRLLPDRRHGLYFAAGTPLALYAFHNWDLVAVFFAVTALWTYRERRYRWTGILLALGTSAKFYPALLAPVLAVHLVAPAGADRPQRIRAALAAAGAFLATLAIVQGPFLLRSPQMFLETYRFHLHRAASPETPWFLAAHYADRIGLEGIRTVGNLPLAPLILATAFIALVSWLLWSTHRRGTDLPKRCLAILLLFMLVNKVFSVQYALWILPLLPLAAVPWRWFAAFALSDLAVYITLFPAIRYHLPLDEYNQRMDVAAIALVLRLGVLLGLFAWTVKRPAHGDPLNHVPAMPAR